MLAFTDTFSALGWLYKTAFKENQEAHDDVARFLAETCIKWDSALYSQHVRGVHNVVSDILSRDRHIDNNQLAFMLKQLFPDQVHHNFKIYTLPPEIVSWLGSLKNSSIKTL